jgi:hypothetical protein
MNWQEILTILVPLIGLMGWTFNRIDKKIDKLNCNMDDEFTEVKKMIHSIDMRLTRLEGRFDERGYWESRKTGTHDDK